MIETSLKNWHTQKNEANQLSTISVLLSVLNRDNMVHAGRGSSGYIFINLYTEFFLISNN